MTIAEFFGKLRSRPVYPDSGDALQLQAAYSHLGQSSIAELVMILEKAEMIHVPRELKEANERLSVRVVLRLLAAAALLEQAAKEAKTNRHE